jgi:hypothetical protein
MRRTEERETDGSTTGQCPVCGDRFRLNRHGLIPKHMLPQRDETTSSA